MVNDTQQIPAGYKQTDVGVIPNSWKALQIRDVAKYRRGSFPQPYGLPQWYDEIGGKPFIQVVDVGENCKLKKTTKQKLSKKAEKYSVFVKKGSVIITIQGSIGRVAVTDYDAYMDRTLLLFESFNVPVDVHFLKYALQVLFEKEKQSAPGGIIKTITKEALSSFVLQIPPIEEQSLISNSLSDIDSLISKLDQLIQKKKNIKQGAMQELLTGKRRLPGFSGEWKLEKVDDFGEIVTGGTPPTSNKSYWNGRIPWITPTDINKSKNIFNSERQITALGLSIIRKLPANSVLVTCIASIGKNAILKKDGACNQQINAIIPNKHHSPDFIYYLMELSKQFLLSNAGITATNIISKKDFAQLEFSVPDLKEQNEIASVLTATDIEIEKIEDKKNKYQELKQGMMQQLLTGKIRLI